MLTNTSGQYFHCLAFNAAGRVSGIAANLSCELSIDGGARTALTYTFSEIGTTGEYYALLEDTETDGHALSFSPVSSSGEQVVGMPSNVIYTFDPTDVTFTVPQSVINQATLPEGTESVYQASQWTITLEGISDGEYANTDYVYFGIKSADGPDSTSALQVKWTKSGATTACTYINGAAAAGAQTTQAVITHSTYDPGDGSTEHRYILVVEGELTALVPTTNSLNSEDRFGDIVSLSRAKYGYSSEWKITGATDLVIGAGYLIVLQSVILTTN